MKEKELRKCVTWNPTTGCTRVSEGCRHCYIEHTPPFRMAGRKFVNGATGVQLHFDRLDQPRHWKRSRKIFVNSLSDLFHEDIPREMLKEVSGVAMDCPQHTFQILTKRPERMREFSRDCPWSPNVWLGVSCEDQATADERIPILLQTPAAVRFISAEPLLGSIDLRNLNGNTFNALDGIDFELLHGEQPSPLNWVLVGGESGPGARPCDVAWIRSIKDQCQAAGVALFYKQGGASNACAHDRKGGCWDCMPDDLKIREYPHAS